MAKIDKEVKEDVATLLKDVKELLTPAQMKALVSIDKHLKAAGAASENVQREEDEDSTEKGDT